ncbi:hypothetical protein QBC32DRAFT_56053 [Pseudoneurospora amorphoporcata]|uniref:Uncharacterized protein n=1 Tax=Pseudoneurospora amorphoporcata TaxID=241081 RepID=A0AAN6P3H5_9PEZI|nr:hypothetical protein QBC32DRAFT_56053 [Pseudoneurospora amorphoporcata]
MINCYSRACKDGRIQRSSLQLFASGKKADDASVNTAYAPNKRTSCGRTYTPKLQCRSLPTAYRPTGSGTKTRKVAETQKHRWCCRRPNQLRHSVPGSSNVVPTTCVSSLKSPTTEKPGETGKPPSLFRCRAYGRNLPGRSPVSQHTPANVSTQHSDRPDPASYLHLYAQMQALKEGKRFASFASFYGILGIRKKMLDNHLSNDFEPAEHFKRFQQTARQSLVTHKK